MSHSPADHRPPSTSTAGTRPYVIAGFICAAVALIFLPILFGPVAVVLGVVAHSKGDPLGKFVIIAGVVGAAIGFALGALVFAQSKDSALALLS